MIVFGDVHIGSRRSKIQDLRRCLKSINPDEVAITGDLFDDQHRRVSRDEAIRLIRKAMDILGLRPRSLYIALSSSSHDPILPSPLVADIDGVEVTAHNGEVYIEGAARAVLSHGDKVVRSGVVAYFLDLARRGYVGRALKRRLGLGGDVWLAYGHSHVPYVDPENKIINPGSWKIYGVRRIRGGVYELPSAKPLCKPDLQPPQSLG
ncbi:MULTISPECIES: metallophosphoesterase family protein [unclassified Pyrobaculum]|uniref:metallophosphoesterase family protein n=1 Tax=unclassified Pyrobaculum TaxID=2643434 RepID=UPI0021D9A8CE|nr:metallophosphoesterase family protein [Pyrobaculum sp. 3827-6]MCU7787250.1 metallophosphoesterase family protein [Pyrobaculum sp. 3827-6]